jgi:hypothetical protein
MKTENLELYPIDSPKQMNWKDAYSYCESLGNSWRMPSIEELNLFYIECKKDNAITNFNYAYYWSSTDNHVGGIKNPFFALGKNFNYEGKIMEIDKENRYGVRPVRNI